MTRTQAYCNRGEAYCRKGEFDAGIGDLTDAIRLTPKEPLPYYNRSMAFKKERLPTLHRGRDAST